MNQCVQVIQEKDPRLSASNRQLIHDDVQFGSAYCGPSDAISLKITQLRHLNFVGLWRFLTKYLIGVRNECSFCRVQQCKTFAAAHSA